MNQPRESDLLRACLQLLALRGVFAWRCNSGAVQAVNRDGSRRFVRFHGEPGLSDIIGLLPGGRLLAVETKSPGKKPTPEQASFLERVAQLGGLALVVTDVRELERALADAL